MTVQSGGYGTVVLLSNAISAGSWDTHFQVPANASWSTNTLSWAGSYTNGTWNGNAIGAIYGGTAQTSYTTGDVLYASATNTLSKLGIGTTGQALTVVGGVPAWATINAGATGGGTDQIFWNNGQTVNTSYSIPASTNAGTFGPVTISSSATVTIPSTSVWTVV